MGLQTTITPSEDARVAVLALHGEINGETLSKMDESIEALLKRYGRVVLDLTPTHYVSSAGWRTLIDRCIKGRQTGIRIAGLQPPVRDVFDLLGMNYVLPAYESVADAIASFSSSDAPTPSPAPS